MFAAGRRHPGVSYELEDRIADARLSGWGGGLRLLVDNLLDNAALHGGGDGRVQVALERENGSLLVRVADDGAGIPSAERERLLEPFARGTGVTAPGTGLGLAIVAQQVTLHAGTLRLGDSPSGGLEVEVRLPGGVGLSVGEGDEVAGTRSGREGRENAVVGQQQQPPAGHDRPAVRE